MTVILFVAALLAVCVGPGPAVANNFIVNATHASDYIINGVADPTVRLYRGRSYQFLVNAAGHPFWIKTNLTTGTGGAFTNGVLNNGTATGTLLFTVPSNAPDILYYICQFHAAMSGVLLIENSPQKGWWRFEETGGTVLDHSGWGVNGVVIGLNTGLYNGAEGYSYDLPGTLITDGVLTNLNQYSYRFQKDTTGRVWILNPVNLRLTNNNFTIEAFIKIQSTNFPMRLIDLVQTGRVPPTLVSPFLSTFGSPREALTIHSDLMTNYYTAFPPPQDPAPLALRHWHHFAVVQNGATSTWYVNYQKRGEVNGAPSYIPSTFTNVHIGTIGAIYNENYNNFDGWIDELRLTEHALAPSQFLRVVGGLAPGIDSMGITGATTHARFVSESGVLYRIDWSTNLLSDAAWTPLAPSTSGALFFTTFSHTAPSSAFYRVLRLSP